ncbi:aminodeoxychorismate lyase [Luteitalea sp. TBR-22]|uniref:endolytic transglycosylase MltG n=1 Tax=Luteitalea sp. TBR-22 TaxID=2802971 RepID=UPI001AF65C28|nr:endolytic transglycosylase MltG [Luteitalea sp. TBR-22]BCS32725.1 aminodeoxychorismate lyase [Luteitalea sp. TBR-22]
MKRFLLFLLLVLLLVALGAGLWVRQRVTAPFAGFSGEQFIEIPQGESTAGIGRRLVEAGVIRDPLTFRLAVRTFARGRSLKAGEYRFEGASTPAEVIERLAKGDVYLVSLTFPEGLTAQEMAVLFGQSGLGSADAFVEASRDPSLIAEVDPQADTLEGYLFPDTYSLPRRISARAMVGRMVKRFTTVFDDDLRRQARATGLTVRQIMSIAALVEKETARAEERPLVAAVYRNRFRIGMPMQADPTVIYALKRAGKWNGNIRKGDLMFDSPYNTYRYPGLPPGPIASPGRAAIEATISPAKVDYLYFVSRNDGSHAFASTLPEHNRNVQKWQVEYFRARR